MAEELHSVRLLRQKAEPPAGGIVLRVDLGACFATAREVGPDPVLLLLTVRALALRDDTAVRISDLCWILSTTPGQIARWLEALEAANLVAWQARGGSLVVEIIRTETERPLFSPEDHPGVVHLVPTVWFLRLPIVGRRGFLIYLFLRSHERAASITEPVTLRAIAQAAGIRTGLGLRLVLARLARARIVTPTGKHGRFVVTDPPPPTRWQRRYLNLLASGALPPTRSGRALVVVALALPIVIFLWILTLFLQ